MFFSPFIVPHGQKISSIVALEPIYNTLMSMALLTSPPLDVQQDPWLAAVAGQLSSEERHDNRLIFEGLGAALLPTAEQADFPAYLHALAVESPIALCERVVPKPSVQLEAMLQQEAEQLLHDPAAMQQLIVTHLRLMWEKHFAAEWQKKESVMHFIATELNSRTWPTESPNALLRAFIRRPIPDWISAQLADVAHIVFVPSPYIQFYATRFGHPSTLWLFMDADPWTWPMRNEPIQRSEVLGPANALADETRLRILELLAAHEEMLAQELIALLDVSQSSVSRHLKQLSRAGFVTEQRAGDANKVYRLQRARVGQFAYTLSQLLSSDNARIVLDDVRLDHPVALRPFLDRNGLVTNWPAKQKGQRAVLSYLITKFTSAQCYTEAEVNDLLKQWHTYNDPAYLRRALVDMRLLKRTPDGAQYWREMS